MPGVSRDRAQRFFNRVGVKTSLTLEEVRRVRFRTTHRGATGHEVGDVDTFIDKVEESFAQFENERDLLRREVEAARTTGGSVPAGSDEALAAKDHEINSLRGEIEWLRNQVVQQAKQQVPVVIPGQLDGKCVAQLTQDNERFRSKLDRARRELDEARSPRASHTIGNTETLQVATREEVTPAVVWLVSLATEQAERLVDKANNEAQHKISEAKQQAYEITTGARTRAERIESEARVNTDRINRDAQSRADCVNGEVDRRRTELLAELEREQGILTQKVTALCGFESSYRENMRSYLSRYLESFEQNLPEPLDVPELVERSKTPRLDALAAQDRLA